MAFWGAVVKPGKPHAFVPPPEDWNLHLSQAALPPTVPDGQRVALVATSDPKDEPIILCTLVAGRTDTALLDLFFSQYTEFSVIGDHTLHLSGYYTPNQVLDEEGEDEDEDEDVDYEPDDDPRAIFPIGPGLDEAMRVDPYDLEEEDEDEDEDDDLDGLDEDEDEDEDDSMDGDDEMFGYQAMLRAKRKPKVVIEDITDKGTAAANGQEETDEDEDEEDDEDEDDEDSEDEDEEMEEAPAKAGAAALGSKRPADAKPAANGVSKADGPAAKKQAVGQQQAKPAAQPAASGKESKEVKKQQQQAKQDAKQEAKGKQEAKQEPKAKQETKAKQEAKEAGKVKEQEAKEAGKKKIRRHPNGFEIEDVSYGNPNGKLAKPGRNVLVRYVGKFKSGKTFDQSGKQPFQFRLGVGQVIKGWDLGVEGMRVGDKRRLVIPPQLAYGAAGVKGSIPPNSTLEFNVELVDVK